MEGGDMEVKELPIYTHMICKGNSLKVQACKLYSFSEKQKDIMKDACKALGLSDLIYEDAKVIYIRYLKMQVSSTGIYATKHPILACVYLSALKHGDPREKRDFITAFNVTPPTISNWARKISRALKMDISWKEYNTNEKL